MDGHFAALRPLAFVYGCITALRNKLFDWGVFPSERFGVPVVCIGNLSAGGTGKTPHTEYLIRLFRNRRVAVLSRGYKRETRGFVLANRWSTAKELGDEPYQMHRKFPEILVAVDADRREGIRNLLSLPAGKRPEIILLDDAFQHRYVSPAFSILLTDWSRLFTGDFILPEGRLRERRGGAARSDAVFVTKCPVEGVSGNERAAIRNAIRKYAGEKPVYFTRVEYGGLRPVFPQNAEPLPGGGLGNADGVLLLSGIANPQPLLERMRRESGDVRLVAFPDHHDFKPRDLRQVESAFKSFPAGRNFIVTTEKDAVRLQGNPFVGETLKNHLYYIPIEIRFCSEEEEKAFVEQLLSGVDSSRHLQAEP